MNNYDDHIAWVNKAKLDSSIDFDDFDEFNHIESQYLIKYIEQLLEV